MVVGITNASCASPIEPNADDDDDDDDDDDKGL